MDVSVSTYVFDICVCDDDNAEDSKDSSVFLSFLFTKIMIIAKVNEKLWTCACC